MFHQKHRSVIFFGALAFAATSGIAMARDLPNLDKLAKSPQKAPRKLTKDERALVKGGKPVQYEERFGVPTFVWTTESSSEEKAQRKGRQPDPPGEAKRHLGQLKSLWNLDDADVANAKVTQVHDTGRGAVIVKLAEDVNGVEVFREEMSVAMDRKLERIAISGYLGGAKKKLGNGKAFTMTEKEAVALALSDRTGLKFADSELSVSGTRQGPYGFVHYGKGRKDNYTVDQPARVKQVYFHTPEGYEAAYYVEVEVSGVRADDSDLVMASVDGDDTPGSTDDAMYSYVISAEDGSILFRKKLSADDSFQYRVWADTAGIHQVNDSPAGNSPTPHPDGTNSGFVPPYVPTTLKTIENIQPFVPVTDVWLPTGALNTTVSNNVDAYADIDGANGRTAGDVVPDVTSPGVFDRAYNPNLHPQSSTNQRKAAVTQMFYAVNHLHDWYYDAGFDELARNGQKSNYGRGGLQNDDIRAEGQDSSGFNNANMSTPADGGRPRMQQFLFINANLVINSEPAAAPTLPARTLAGVILGGTLVNPSAEPQTVTGNLVLVNDGSTAGTLGTTADACQTPFVNAGAVNGNIALVDRAAPVAGGSNGGCSILTKIANAQANGAIGFLLGNNNSASLNQVVIFGNAACPTCTIPFVDTSLNIANALKADLLNGPINVTLRRGPELDGTIDNQIVQHEWGHYLSNRLVGNAAGLVNNQGGSMGEGWGDFNALINTIREGDDLLPNNAAWSGTYSMAGYTTVALRSDSWYFGIRRLPYSSDMTKNPLTFKHIANGNTISPPFAGPCEFGCGPGTDNAEVHNAGEVWATMLWESLVALLNNHPFNDARERMRDYLVGGLKLTPIAPTFTEARDGVLAAAYAADPADYALICAAFAKRGAGTRAVSPDRFSTTHVGVVESYECAPNLTFVSASLSPGTGGCDSDPYLDNFETATLTVTLKNDGSETLSNTTAHVSSANPSLIFENGGDMTFPPSNPFTNTTATIDVSMLGASGVQDFLIDITYTDSAITFDPPEQTSSIPARGNADEIASPSATDDVEPIQTAWTQGGTGGVWTQQFAPPTVPPTFNRTWLGADPGNASSFFLVSPVLNVNPTGNFTFTFRHRHSFEFDSGGFYDGGILETSTNGGATWQKVPNAALTPTYNHTLLAGNPSNVLTGTAAYSGTNPAYPAFDTVTANLGTGFQGLPTLLRFRIGSDSFVGAPGWEIDDIDFSSGISNTPIPWELVGHLAGQAPPAISNLAADPEFLWPANHTMRDVNITYDVASSCPFTCSLSVASNEPQEDHGDGSTDSDWEVVDENSVRLRAERSGKGDGREYTVTVTCTDGTNSSSDDVIVYVSHNITAPSAGAAFEVGKSVNFAGTFRDLPGERHTATWSFDNLSAKADVTEPTHSRAGTVRGSYTFSAAGVYSVKMNVSRRGGLTGTSEAVDGADALLVIYDPKGGYVSGGGSFDSPAGAYADNPGAKGKAAFGFVSKYFKNATNPKGETTFGLQAAGFKFNAVNFDYLVVDGAKAFYKGFGQVNSSGYEFILSVVDGQIAGDGVDKIRIKIWEKNSKRVVYDTQPGDADLAAPTTALSGNVITIHP